MFSLFLKQDWAETIYNSLLLLFFGFFGGRNSVSRTVMLWGAPMCFILQARPVKMWSKILFYLMANPPGVISSLLPAPQQAILNANIEESFAALYRSSEEETSKAPIVPKVTAQRQQEAKPAVVEQVKVGEDEEIDDSDELDESEGEGEEDDDTEDE